MPRPSSSARRAASRSPARKSATTQWLTGLHCVREALRARRRRLELLQVRAGSSRDEHRELVELAASAGVAVEDVADRELEARGGGDSNPQGVALRVGPLPELSLDALAEAAGGLGPGSRLLALDGVEDPQNVGAVARVAESAGVRGLVLTQRRSPPLSPTVSRASTGAIEWLPVARVPNLGRALAQLQEWDYWVVAASREAGQRLYEMEDRLLSGQLVVVLGAEGRGIRPSIAERADYRVEIPMMGRIDSLNVSTAGAVILYELLRRELAREDETRGDEESAP
ncbi:MAG: 23S rRNA (guanosine(2251)-2'-O)-methyltransferase RlmB [Deltaproteobacteria bacterium]|jgi:23S rRNA (guanosine2251-2'-O)-methyltransferase|nr:23S rRNA (guanosine(2251)-2'-O)-methyltransferase RlmB [Deltaproteobacteria bacterium]MBW2501154.1 23S rRNA (guanosine(2251)-2'-O)-methyltransferase RlmB [Deltaproteobacteria bacterium]